MPLTAADLLAREERELSPCAQRSARSRGRRHPEPEHPYRVPFQRDRDRIIHTTAFRRLQSKTQVFVTHEGDHFRTRLTHTMEVVQIARTIARALALNEDLAEAIALAHDLGHTPFGHAGEEALRELLAAHGGFEHNRQSLRLVDLLEERYPGHPGLNLTWEVREGIARHQTTHDRPEGDELAAEFPPGRAPGLEAQAVSAADVIAYDTHDLDDALAAGLLRPEDLAPVALWREAQEAVGARGAALPEKLGRRQTVLHLINLQVSDLLETSAARIAAAEVADAEAVRALGRPLVGFSAPLEEKRRELESCLMERFYRHYRITRMTRKARLFIGELFHAYVEDPGLLPADHRARAARDGVHRAAGDYIAGMTDSFAQAEYKRLFFPFERV